MPRFVASDFVSLVYTIGLLVVAAGILFALYRVFIQAISTVMLWMLFGLTLVACYSYRLELRDIGRRLFPEVVSTHQQMIPDGAREGRQSIAARN